MKSKSFRVSIIIVGVLAVIAIVAIMVGVLTHKERTLLLTCWEEDGTANYVEDGTTPSCDHPEEIILPRKQIPMTISVLGMDDEAQSQAFSKSLASEVQSLNAELSMKLFSMTPEAGYVLAQEVASEHSQGKARGIATHRRDPQGNIFVDLKIVSGLDMQTFHEVCRHELLHVAGLAHDDYEESVMFPMVPEFVFSKTLPRRRISDADRDRIQTLYR